MSFRTAYGYLYSENGWRMCNADHTAVYDIGGGMRLRLRNGYAGEVLAAFARWYHDNVEPVDAYKPTDDWGWSATNDVPNSNHLSGTAFDINATQYPFGRRTMPRELIARVRVGLALFEGNVFWGADWSYADEMHFQLNTGTAAGTGASERLIDFCRRRIRNGRLIGDETVSAAEINKFTENFIKGYLGPNNSDTKDVRYQLTGSRDLVYVVDPRTNRRVVDLAASFPGHRQLGNRTLVDAVGAIGAHLGIPGFLDTLGVVQGAAR